MAAKAGPIGPFSRTRTRFMAPDRPVRTIDAPLPSQEATCFLIPTSPILNPAAGCAIPPMV